MSGVAVGFTVVGVVIALGWFLRRVGTLDEQAGALLSRVGVTVATPALVFATLARADLTVIASTPLLVTACATSLVAAAMVVVVARRRPTLHDGVIAVLCASLVNAGNIGIPIATYVLGSATYIAPVVLFQQLVMLPAALTALGLSGDGRPGLRQLLRAVANPVNIASLAGVAMALSGAVLPTVVSAPLGLVGNLAVPAILLAFGASLHGSPLVLRGPDGRTVALATFLKVVVHPALTWAVAHLVFGLDGKLLLVVVVCAALPAAQNIFAFATRFGSGVTVARSTVAVTSVLSVPAVALTVLVLGGS